MAFRSSSIELTKILSKETKQSQGIFFTPKEARDRVFELLDVHNIRPSTILEPSCGSGEFLYDCLERFPTSSIVGIEKNETLYNSFENSPVILGDFLTYSGKHDLIIGNPPYFVIDSTPETQKCQSGRPNIFVQFIYKAVSEILTENGTLAFVLPTSLFNCVYYEPLRKYLYENTTILEAEVLSGKYLDTQQPTFVLILQQRKRNDNFFICMNGNHYIVPDYKKMRNMLKKSTTLETLGFETRTGEVVWNQEKEKLTDSGIPIIYSGNLTSGTLILDNVAPPKKQYIQGFRKPPLTGKSILINRGYGNAELKLNPVLVDIPEYYAENHVNVIRPRTEIARYHIPLVLKSLKSKKTVEFIRMFSGNNALSKSELQYCLPIWID